MQATERKEHPILSSGEMVRAILDGRKTMTRRVMRYQPSQEWSPYSYGEIHGYNKDGELDPGIVKGWGPCSGDGEEGYCCPYGKPGDLLWVRETWCIADHDFGMENGEEIPTAWLFQYRAFDGFAEQSSFDKHCAWRNPPKGTERSIAQKFGTANGTFNESGNRDPFRWRPSVHMPKWVSRIKLEVMNVRVERNASTDEWEWVVELKLVEAQPQVTRTMIVVK